MIPPCALLTLNKSASLPLRPLLMALQRQVLRRSWPRNLARLATVVYLKRSIMAIRVFSRSSELALNLDQQQRMTAEIEKIAMQPDTGNLQDFGPDFRNHGFHSADRGFVILLAQLLRQGQCLTVNLAVGLSGSASRKTNEAGKHVIGKHSAERCLQHRGV